VGNPFSPLSDSTGEFTQHVEQGVDCDWAEIIIMAVVTLILMALLFWLLTGFLVPALTALSEAITAAIAGGHSIHAILMTGEALHLPLALLGPGLLAIVPPLALAEEWDRCH
jgi:hypothetical protein